MQRAIRFVLLGWLVLAFYTQIETGLADNSDFSRTMTHFTSGPAHLDENWPDARVEPEKWQRRFFSYWIPHWRLDFPNIKPAVQSSVVLLWYPGVVFNYLFYSESILSMQFVALFPRLLLLAELWLLLRWIEQHTRRPLLMMAALALPLTLLVSSHNYTIFLSSFYAETGSFVYGFGLLVALLYLEVTKQWRWFAAALLLTMLLMTAKASHLHVVLIVPLLVLLKGLSMRPTLRNLASWRVGVATVLCMGALVVLGQQFGRNPNLIRYNSYNSLFFGVLPLSDDPQAHLDRLELSSATYCVDKLVYTFVGGICNKIYGDKMRFTNTLRVIAAEPQLLLRIPKFVADEMHSTSLNYLGRRSESDPWVLQWKETHRGVFNLWPQLRNHFPVGFVLYLMLGGYMLCFALLWQQQLAKIGLWITALVPIDMAIAFLGDGRQELAKHLLFANWLLDVATALLLAVVLMWVAERTRERLPQTAIVRAGARI